MAEVLPGAARARSHDRAPDGHRLERHEAPRLPPPDREHQRVGLRVGARQLVARPADEGHAPLEVELAGQLAKLGQVTLVAFADHRERRLGRELGQGSHRRVDSLTRVDAPKTQ